MQVSCWYIMGLEINEACLLPSYGYTCINEGIYFCFRGSDMQNLKKKFNDEM